jgi:dolichol kinase
MACKAVRNELSLIVFRCSDCAGTVAKARPGRWKSFVFREKQMKRSLAASCITASMLCFAAAPALAADY